jgi:hypothetical protein
MGDACLAEAQTAKAGAVRTWLRTVTPFLGPPAA